MAYSTPSSRSTGFRVTAAVWNQDVVDNVAFLANPPACRAYHNAAQSVASATLVAVALNAERYDSTGVMHDLVTNNNRINFATAGLYTVTGHVQWASNATGYRGLFIYVNGTASGTRLASDYRNATNGDVTEMSIATTHKFSAGEYVVLGAYQTSGAGLNINSVSAYSPEFTATWVGLG